MYEAVMQTDIRGAKALRQVPNPDTMDKLVDISRSVFEKLL